MSHICLSANDYGEKYTDPFIRDLIFGSLHSSLENVFAVPAVWAGTLPLPVLELRCLPSDL